MTNEVKLKSYIKMLKEKKMLTDKNINISDYLNDVVYNDYPKFYRTLDSDLISYKDFLVIGSIKFINIIAKLNDYSTIYLAIEYMPPILWYKIETVDQLCSILEGYNIIKNKKKMKSIRGFLGTTDILQLDLDGFEKYAMMHLMTDKMMWGPMFTDYPYRDALDKMSTYDFIVSLVETLQQIPDSNIQKMSVKSTYSESVITIEIINKCVILEVNYRPIADIGLMNIKNINLEYNRKYPDDMPFDVLSFVTIFPFLTHLDLLEMEPIQPYIAFEVAKEDDKSLAQIISKMQVLLDEQMLDDTIKSDLNQVIMQITINMNLSNLLNNDKNLYERIISGNYDIDEIKNKCNYANKDISDDDVLEHIESIINTLTKS